MAGEEQGGTMPEEHVEAAPDTGDQMGRSRHFLRHWKRVLLGVAAFLLLALALLVAFLGTEQGSGFIRDQLDDRFIGDTLRIDVEDIEGSVYGRPTLVGTTITTYDPVLSQDGDIIPGQRGPRRMEIYLERTTVDADLLRYLRTSVPGLVFGRLSERMQRFVGYNSEMDEAQLRLRDVDIAGGELRFLSDRESPDTGSDPIPQIDLGIEQLTITDFLIPAGTLTQEDLLLALDGTVVLDDGRAMARGSGTVGDDRFALDLNYKTDAPFQLSLDVDATDGGPLTALAGLDGAYDARIRGRGTIDEWTGYALASRGGDRIGAFRILKRGERASLSGIANPGSFLTGIPAQALGERVRIGAVADLADLLDTERRTLDGAFSLTGAGVRANGSGMVDLAQAAFDGFDFEAVLTDSDLLGDTATLEDARIEGQLNGPLANLSIRHSLSASRIVAGAVELADVAQTGEATYANGRFVLPLQLSVGRILTGNEMADPRLTDGTIAGNLVYSGDTLASDRLDISFPGADARFSLDANLATQSVRLRGPAAINRVPIETLGIVNGGGRIDFAYSGDGSWTLTSDFDAAVPVVTNDTIANLAGPRLDLAGGVTLTSAGPITFRQVRLDSRDLDLVLDGRVNDGETSVAGTGRHTQYGAFTVEAALTGRGPEAILVFAEPLPAAGLRDVRVALSPTEEGFAIETQGQSMLGAFDGVLGLVSPADGPTRIAIERLTVAETEVTGALALGDSGVSGDLALVGGGVDGTIALDPRGGGQGFTIDLEASNARFGGETPLVIAQGSIQGSGVFAGGISDPGTTADAMITAQGVSYGSLFIGRLAANAQLRGGLGEITASVSGRRDSRFALQLNAQVAPERISVAARGEYAGERISMPRRAVLTSTGDGWQLAPTQVDFAGGTTQVEAEFGGSRTRVNLALDRMPLTLTDIVLDELGLGGTISGTVVYDAPAGGLPSGEARVSVDGLTRSGLVLASRPIDLSLVGRLTAERLEARAVLDDEGGQRGRVQMLVSNLPQSGDLVPRLQAGDLLAELRYQGPAAALWRLAAIDAFDFTGPASVAANVTGTLANPQLSGSLASDSLRVQSALSGTDIRDVSVRGNFAGSRLRLTRFNGTAANGGSVSGSGYVDLANLGAGRGPEMDIRVAASNARLLDARGLSATLTGPLRIVSDGVGGTIAGRVTVNRASWAFGVADEDVSLPEIPTEEINLPFDIAPPTPSGAPWRYLINAVAPSRVDVDGMGLDSEWSADIRLRGTTDDPRIGGEARVVRGFYSFAGTRFELTRGRIEFDENGPIDPQIDIMAETQDNGIDVEVSVQGNGQNPDISFSSTPALPEEEILASLLFGGSVTDLSATDAVQLGAALASLRGGGGGLDPINQLRTAIGLDRLRIVGADPALNRGTGVALGKNFGRRFYVELITDGRGYTATELEFRVTSWLSLLAAVSSIGRESAVAEISRDY
ncbi:translocation/assembly module TamB domain-containing protein [Altererythrobacter sp. MTPC7]|uniref:translocation/assembly module TamB domain-containing protein n=1 Tax=Altererythrobacter sp. MTPC7 TaxID=3056567 RepID=UPI0036F43172